MYGVKRGKAEIHQDTMNNEIVDKDLKRKSRNLIEKKRRDQFNLLVNELCTLVSSGGRKMDKSTVLQSSILFLKNHNEVAARSRIHEIQEDWKPSFLANEEFFHLVFEAVHGFIIVFAASGQIFYASESITPLLGYSPNELLTTNLYELILEEEQNSLYNSLMSLAEQDNGQLTFACHFKCSETNDHCDFLELVNVTGYFKTITEVPNNPQKCRVETPNRVFVGTGTLQTPRLIRDMFIIENKSEFTSRHSLEWKFLFLDHRAPPIIGYLPFELLGTSGYDYYHVDDLDNVIECHKTLMQKSEGTSCYYRFLTKGQQWIWLQTRFFITYHQWNSKPECIVCSHRVVGYWNTSKQHKIDAPKSPSIKDNCVRWTTKPSQRSSELLCSSEAQRSTNSKVPEDTCCTKIPHQETILPLQPIATAIFSSDINSEQILMQADLQKKHDQLQASIGQQQAELTLVSEQLLMAKLGLIPAQSQQTHTTAAYALNSPGAVSSTTLLSTVQNDMLTPLIAVSSTDSFQVLDSNISRNLTELK